MGDDEDRQKSDQNKTTQESIARPSVGPERVTEYAILYVFGTEGGKTDEKRC